jgi:hypothetical protein
VDEEELGKKKRRVEWVRRRRMKREMVGRKFRRLLEWLWSDSI